MVTSLWIVLLMTIESLWSPWWTSPFPPNLVLYIVKNSYLQQLSSPTVLIIKLLNFNTSFYMVTSLCIVFLIIFLLEFILNLVLLLIFLLIFIIYYAGGLYISLYFPLCLSCYGIYWLARARRFTSGQIAQLVENLPSDHKIVGSNRDSALNTFSFKNAKIVFLLYFHRMFSRTDPRSLQIKLYIMHSCKTYMFVCWFIAWGACSSVGTAWSSHSFGHGFETHWYKYITPLTMS